jgi:hypothetical protein
MSEQKMVVAAGIVPSVKATTNAATGGGSGSCFVKV